jgi:oligopeptide transport system ATP-binding protein
MSALLKVDGLETRFYTRDGVVHAVNGISYTVQKGETLGIVGESGSGKSVSVLSLLGLIPSPPGKICAGTATFKGLDLLALEEEKLRKIRGDDIGLVFQDPMTSLNPVLTIERQITESVRLHQKVSKEKARQRALTLLDLVGIPEAKKQLGAYPHEFSGGMRQRVMIAIALACEPDLLIADEPTTALDVTIQAQILRLVKDLSAQLDMSIIWITHDLAVVAGLADRIAVMYGGYIVEMGPMEEIFHNPQHPYTKALLESIPDKKSGRDSRLYTIPGSPPVLYHKPTYCPFAPRCPYIVEKCAKKNPPLLDINQEHGVACWVDFRNRRIRSR